MEPAVVSNDGDSVGSFVSLDVGITRLSDVNRPKSCPSNIQQLPGGYQLIPPDPEDTEYYNASYIGRIVFNPWASIPEENIPDYGVEDAVPESPGHAYVAAGNQQEQGNQEAPRSKQKRRAEDNEMGDVEEDDGQKKVRLEKFPCDKCCVVLEGEESWRNHMATPIHQETDGEISPRTVSAGMNTSS